MSLQVIPLSTAPNQSFTVLLDVDDRPLALNITIRFNEMAGYWVLSISDIDNVLMIDSIPMVTGSWPAANLLGQQRYLKIGSWYVVNLANLTPTVSKNVGWGQGFWSFGPYGGQSGQSGEDWPDSHNLGTDFQLWVDDTPTL